MSNKTPHFCIVPWINSMVYTDSTHHFCCISNAGEIKDLEGSKAISIREQSIAEVRNSPFMRNIRKKMIENEMVPGCEICIEQERWGKKSFRQNFNQEWKGILGEHQYNKIVQESISNNYKLINDLCYLDLRLGNICNLKCRMCNPINSSGWANEYETLYNNDPKFQTISTYAFGDYLGGLGKSEYNDWTHSEELWQEVYSFIPNLRKVYLTGGEPTLIKQNIIFLKKIIELKRQDQISIFFNTNATNISDDFIELISQFKRPLINISVDGVGLTNDYIRYPSNWKKISANIEKIARIPQVIMNLTPVFQVYNLFSLIDLFEYAQNLSLKLNRIIGIDTLYNLHPHHLDIRILPKELRMDALRSIEHFELSINDNFQNNWLVQNSLKGMKGILKEEQHKNKDFLLTQFWDFTKSLDQSREQSFKKACPKLYQYFTKELRFES